MLCLIRRSERFYHLSYRLFGIRHWRVCPLMTRVVFRGWRIVNVKAEIALSQQDIIAGDNNSRSGFIAARNIDSGAFKGQL